MSLALIGSVMLKWMGLNIFILPFAVQPEYHDSVLFLKNLLIHLHILMYLHSLFAVLHRMQGFGQCANYHVVLLVSRLHYGCNFMNSSKNYEALLSSKLVKNPIQVYIEGVPKLFSIC